MKSVVIKNPGLLTTIQGNSRTGFRRFGMPVAGAMDIFAMRCANWLVGNNQFSPVLESTLLGPEIEFQAPMQFSITGARCKSTIDNEPVESWKTIKAGEGSILKVSPADSGTRIYISFSGGLSIDEIMGSASTYLPAKVGGLNGRGLMNGDVLKVNDPVKPEISYRVINRQYIPGYTGLKILRVLAGADIGSFTKTGVEHFLSKNYKISLYSDRMGIRLDGDPIESVSSESDVISYGIHSGAIQISGDGKPIIMCADAQTTGGYRQIANVITADQDILAQLLPSQEVRFKLIEYNEAITLLREKEKLIDQILL